MLGFSYNGRHCSQFGICMKSKNRSLLPKPKTYTEEVMERDGVYDFSAVNPLNRVLVSNREITIECNYVASSHRELYDNAKSIASWLMNGNKRLFFDDTPDYYYIATLREKIDLSVSGKRGGFVLVFDCEPYAYSINSSVYQVNCTEKSNSCAFTNNGFYVYPTILIQGSFKNFKIEGTYTSLKYNGSGEGIFELNFNNKTAMLNNANVLPLLSGEFFELLPGLNTIYITADEINASVYINFIERYL